MWLTLILAGRGRTLEGWDRMMFLNISEYLFYTVIYNGNIALFNSVCTLFC
jgi:hypothetical protein